MRSCCSISGTELSLLRHARVTRARTIVQTSRVRRRVMAANVVGRRSGAVQTCGACRCDGVVAREAPELAAARRSAMIGGVSRIELAHDRYRSKRPKSAAADAQARAVMPGGNTRSVLHFDPFPFRVAAAEGPYLHDIDGFTYLDLLGNYTAGLLGHSPAPIRRAVSAALETGFAIGATLYRRDRSGAACRGPVRFDRAGALHQLRDRGQSDGAWPGAAPHRPIEDRRVRGGLSRRCVVVCPRLFSG